jgi:hypothetical protein
MDADWPGQRYGIADKQTLIGGTTGSTRRHSADAYVRLVISLWLFCLIRYLNIGPVTDADTLKPEFVL